MEGVSKDRFIQAKLVLAPQSGCLAVLHRHYGIRAAYYLGETRRVATPQGGKKSARHRGHRLPWEPRSQVAITQGGDHHVANVGNIAVTVITNDHLCTRLIIMRKHVTCRGLSRDRWAT